MSLGQLAVRSAHVADALRALGLKPGQLVLRPQSLVSFGLPRLAFGSYLS